MLRPVYQKQFEKDVKVIKKRNKNIEKLKEITELLLDEKPLPAKNRNHKLVGNHQGFWECHIDPDWLLIYQKTVSEIIFVRTGSHSDLF